jgi:hypothetical protein
VLSREGREESSKKMKNLYSGVIDPLKQQASQNIKKGELNRFILDSSNALDKPILPEKLKKASMSQIAKYPAKGNALEPLVHGQSRLMKQI